MDARDIGLILLSALCGFFGTVFLINAYRIGDPSRITVFEYYGLIPTMLLGFLIWNDIPTNKTWLGVLIIIGCGLYLFNKENSFPDNSPQEIN